MSDALMECRIQSARDRFEKIGTGIRSALNREVHGWIWALEQTTAEMETESSLSSDVKAWKRLIEAYDALFELVQPPCLMTHSPCMPETRRAT